MNLFEVMEAIRDSGYRDTCAHSRASSESTLIYKGASERTFEQYYECNICGGFKVFSSVYPGTDITYSWV